MFDSPYSNITYDKNLDAVICTWKSSGDTANFQKTMSEGMSILKETQCKTWIGIYLVEVETMPECPEWYANEFVPQTMEISVENIYFIIPPKSKIKNEIEEFMNSFSEFYNSKIFSSLEELKAELLKL